MKIYEQLVASAQKKGGGYFILIDPDTRKENELRDFVSTISNKGVDAFLIGGSLIMDSTFETTIKIVKETCSIPVIIFPGSLQQISSYADAILFLSIISGRNPRYLIGDQVIAAPAILKSGLEPISTGYMLFESGRTTTAEFMSNTKPLPVHKPEIAVAHALAAQYLGMKTIYLEAGSGADQSIPVDIIKAIRKYVNIPIITGGGIVTPDDARKKVEAGATFIVTGNIFDDDEKLSKVEDFAKAIHYKEK